MGLGENNLKVPSFKKGDEIEIQTGPLGMNKVCFDKLPGCPKMARCVLSTVIPHPPTNIKSTNIYHSRRVDNKMDYVP